MKITIDTEDIKQQLARHPNAKEIFEELFPTAFNGVDIYQIANNFEDEAGNTLLEIREGGNCKDRAFLLNEDYDWKVTRDNDKILVLIPLVKQPK